MPNRLILAGGIMLTLGMLVAVLAAGVAGGPRLTAHAQLATGTADPTPDPCVEIDSFAFGEQQDPNCDPPGPGPRLTPSPAATDTPEPAPTDEPPTVAPTATSPSGGAGAGGVQPPNTGDGSGSGSDAPGNLFLAMGLILTLGGGSLVTLGARRRS